VTADGVPIIILVIITITMAGVIIMAGIQIIMDGETITITTQIPIIIMDGVTLIIMRTIIIMDGGLPTIMVGEIIIL
jgi:hypothetical protein